MTPFTNKSTAPRRRERCLGLLLAALFFVAQLYSASHHAFTDHTVCSSTGQVLHNHVDHGHGDHGHQCSSEPRQEPSTPEEGSVEAGEELHLGHGAVCHVPISFAEYGAPLGAKAPQAVWVQRTADVLPVRYPRPVGSIPVFRIAPKQSPPQRA